MSDNVLAPRRFTATSAHTLSEREVRRLVGNFHGQRLASVVDGFEFRPGFLYNSVRAISARINQNYDAWPSAELKKSFRSFLGKPCFVNHHNEDPSKARGRVVAARYIEKGADHYIEVIQEIDAKRFPKLAHEIRTGGMDSVSMGVEAGFTKCSICDNKASDIFDMCNHVKFHKGEYLTHPKTGKKTLVYENCFKLGFFELSYVFDPADETAVISRVIAASRRQAGGWSHDPGHSQAVMGDGHSLHVYSPHQSAPIDEYQGGSGVLLEPGGIAPGTGSAQHEWVHTHGGEPVNGGMAPSHADAMAQAENSHRDLTQGWDSDPFDPRHEASYHRFAKAKPSWVPHVDKDTGQPYPMPDPGNPVYVHRFQPAFERMRKTGQPQPDLWSVGTTKAHPETGKPMSRVHGYTDQIHLLNPEFKVGESGNKKSNETGVRNVHAKVYGMMPGPVGDHADQPDEALPYSAFNYNPGVNGVPGNPWFYHRDVTDESDPIESADHAHFSPDGRTHAAAADNWGRDHEPSVFHDPHPSLNASNRHTVMQKKSRRRHGFGETRAPEEVDTLRREGEDDDGDWTRDPHKRWIEQTAANDDMPWKNMIESPAELQAPDLDQAKRLDRDQEDEGLDDDRHAEDAEDFGAPSHNGQPDPDYDDPEDDGLPAMPINPPESKKGRRTSYRGASMSRRRYYAAEDEGQYPEDDGSGQYPDDGGQGGPPDDGGDQGQQEDPDDLVSQAEDDLDAYDQQQGGGGDDGGPEEGYDDSEYGDDDQGDDQGDDEDEESEGQGSDGGDLPPWLQEGREANRRTRRAAQRPVKKQTTRSNRRAAEQGGGMSRQSLATRQRTAAQAQGGRRHYAGDDGHTDGGPYGVDDSQGAQEDIFISQVPSAEAVDLGDDESGISNNPGNLVASRFDPNHYQRIAEVISALPPQERHAMAYKMAVACKKDNPRFNWRTLYAAAQVPFVRTAEDLVSPDKVDPSLPDSGASDLKGDEFDSLALDNVETQPKDASIHAFRQFDSWLKRVTGKTARQHGNANFIRRAAVSYAKRTNRPDAALQGLFPTLDYVLHYARSANMDRYAEDQSLDVAAPGGRIDVEAPVKNVTDAEAQSSQFDLGDFANNAGDSLADPVLDAVDGNAGTWAPDKEARVRLASGVEAMRCAEAHIAAMPDKYNAEDRWQLTARFETMRQAVVRDRTRLLEDVIKSNRTARKQVTAGRSRGTNGIPQGLGSGRRTAGTRREAANDPKMDAAIFF